MMTRTETNLLPFSAGARPTIPVAGIWQSGAVSVWPSTRVRGVCGKRLRRFFSRPSSIRISRLVPTREIRILREHWVRGGPRNERSFAAAYPVARRARSTSLQRGLAVRIRETDLARGFAICRRRCNRTPSGGSMGNQRQGREQQPIGCLV